MNFKGLDLNLLVALDILLLEKNTTRAGERLCLSQSAVSGALSRLREYFNDELLVQVGRNFVLTPLAASLVEPLNQVLRQIDTTIATKARFDPATATRRFVVMGSDYAMTVLVSKVLQHAAQIAPGISFALRQTRNSWHDELTRGTLDLVLIPELFSSGQSPRSALFQDDFTCVVCAANPLIGDEISREQYLALGHVGVAFDHPLNPSIEHSLLQKQGVNRRMEVLAPTFNLLPWLVMGTQRVATMHTRLAHLLSQSLPLKLCPLPVPIPSMTETMQWPAHHNDEPGSVWLRQLLLYGATQLDA